jgi:hypothetical protein
MKTLPIFCLMASFTLGCSDDPELFIDVQTLSGIWVPYEVKYADGTMYTGTFTAMSIFGNYAESVQLNEDETFVPLIWLDKDNYTFKIDESGSFEYASQGHRLFFTDGAWDIEFHITKYNKDQLWLIYTGDVALQGAEFRFKRVIPQ